MKAAALVTGSSQRLGKTLALRLAREGYFTWVHYRKSEEKARAVLEKIRKGGGEGDLVRGNLSHPEDVQKMAKILKKTNRPLGVLVNNVGQYTTGNLLDLPPEHFSETLEANLVGPYQLIQALLDQFPKSGGSIVNIGYTGLQALGAAPQNTAYTISKTGLLLLTRSYAQLLGPRNIRVNMVSPGQQGNSVDLPQPIGKYVPLKRAGTDEDIVEAVVYLISKKADYVTGQNLEISGGFMLGLHSHFSE